MSKPSTIPARLKRESIDTFESIKKFDENGNEYWLARPLARILGYTNFRNFLNVIEKAKIACINSNHEVSEQFVDVDELLTMAHGAKRKFESYKLSRYACYLIVQNADPNKEIVAQGQTYFAIQTRIAEVEQMQAYQTLTSEEEKRLFLRDEMVKHNLLLADAAKGAGVADPQDYAIFQNFGYKGLYGGLDAQAIHKRKGLKDGQKILDHMGSTELAANLFRATQTEEKIRRENIHGKAAANMTHYEVGRKVRKTIEELGGTMPEDLPTAESILEIEKKRTSPELPFN